MMEHLLDDLPLRTIFYTASVIGIVLIVFLMKTLDHVDDVLGVTPHRLWLAGVRRISMLFQVFAMSLCVIYGYHQNWDPWPPFVLWIIACDVQHFVRILTCYRGRLEFSSDSFGRKMSITD